MSLNRKNRAMVIPHTHWDREWRYPIWKNRMLLIEFMDSLLKLLDDDEEYNCFLMDGQVAPIEDYLEVMPQNKERVLKHIKDGRIAIGPWYTLPDLYPVSGESLVRNLLKGTRVCREYGDYLKVGYNSFGWGQTAQFPQIYAGFDMDFIICAKKVSKERAPQSEFMWEGPDGTRVLTSRLGEHARANFYFNAFLYSKYGFNCTSSEFRYKPDISGVAFHNAMANKHDEDFFMLLPKENYSKEFLVKGIEEACKATNDTVLKEERLYLNGTDFSTPHPELSKMLKDLNEIDSNTEYINCRLEEYAKVLNEKIDKSTLITVKGELRDGPAGECSGNALSSRIYLKQLNKKAENILMYEAEPYSVAAELINIPYEKSFLDRGWKYLLQSHPHDSINGVTQDKTANDVEYRLNQAIEIGEVTKDKAIGEIIKKIDLSNYNNDDFLLVVFNPHPYATNEILKVCIAAPREAGIWNFSARDCDGNKLMIQEISRDEKAFPVHDQEARPWPYLADRHFYYIQTGDVPALGYKVIQFIPEKHFDRNHFYWLTMRENLGEDICKADNILENEYLKVEINSNGTLKVTDKENKQIYDGLHYFEDAGDVGNYWAYYPPYHNKVFTTLTSNVSSWLEDNGPLSATIAIQYKMELPVKGFESRHGIQGEGKRSDDTDVLIITSRITLKKDSKRVDINTKMTNNICNHRLRVAFPTGIKADNVCAAGHFTVDKRPATPKKESNGTYWPEMQTLPMQTFVDVSDSEKGIALLNNCLTEYEMCDDEKHTLYLTLFRAMGNMIVTWSEAVGEFDDQIGSQLQRNMEFNYSIYPHMKDWQESNVYVEAQNFNVPLGAYQVCGSNRGENPESLSFMSISNDKLICSSFKKAEDRNSYVIRVYNPTDYEQEGIISLIRNINGAWLCNLNEERQEPISCIDDKSLSVKAGSNKIITIEIEV
ncbi:MAG: glycoside hydrolase family 38 C-terminal domain-containing protein [Clostridium sp.]|nr:glycoside hydrolase family 38 C-terminal domain-containing protein [Clostridium sp.]